MPELIHYNVLFTGGLDSAYRLCQLARDKKAVVQPIYIVFPDDGKSLHVRPELQRELEAQDKILEYLINHPNTKAKILPIKRIYRDEIPKDQRIMDLDGYLIENGLGWQYLYFACLSVWYSNLELCHEDYMSYVLCNKYKYKTYNGIRILDSDGIDEKFYLLFKNFSWPIFGIRRKQMIPKLDEWGFHDIKSYVFFCYDTINGEPCGICDNCRAKIKQGLKFLFTNASIHRYLLYYYVKTHFGGNYFKYFSLYMRRNNNKHLVFSFDKDVLFFFKSIDRVNALDNHTLKNVIINGSLKYGFSDYKKEQILSYRHRSNRKKLFDYLD